MSNIIPTWTSPIVEPQINFAFDLLREANAANPNNSTILSPVSVAMLLSLVLNGARGNTADELRKVLGNGESTTEIGNYFSNMLDHAKQAKNYTWDVAGRIYVNRDYRVSRKMISIGRSKYHVGLQRMDFRSPDNVAKTINKYVSQHTHNKITDLISANDIQEEIRLILVNAVYFQAEWVYKFSPSITGDFYQSQGRAITVSYMNQIENLPYYENNELQCLALPYVGNDVTAYFILPKERFGLNDLLGYFTAMKFKHLLLNKLSVTEVEVKIPKFTLKSEHDLKTLLLKKLPLSLSSRADFSDLVENSSVTIDQFRQKALVEVDENGTTAAASTFISFVDRSSSRFFYADHPFLFVMADRRGSIYFTATVRL